MAVEEIERAKFNVKLTISLFLEVFESKSWPTLVNNRSIGISCVIRFVQLKGTRPVGPIRIV